MGERGENRRPWWAAGNLFIHVAGMLIVELLERSTDPQLQPGWAIHRVCPPEARKWSRAHRLTNQCPVWQCILWCAAHGCGWPPHLTMRCSMERRRGTAESIDLAVDDVKLLARRGSICRKAPTSQHVKIIGREVHSNADHGPCWRRHGGWGLFGMMAREA